MIVEASALISCKQLNYLAALVGRTNGTNLDRALSRANETSITSRTCTPEGRTTQKHQNVAHLNLSHWIERRYTGLIHPVHQTVRVFAWQVLIYAGDHPIGADTAS